MSDEVVIVEVVKRMERDLKQFDLILFFTGEKEFVEEWISCAVKAAELKDSSKKIGILSDSDISNQNCCNCVYRRVDREEREVLERLYFTYDFSDQFIMISDKQQFGGLLNYIKTGTITREEMIRALIG